MLSILSQACVRRTYRPQSRCRSKILRLWGDARLSRLLLLLSLQGVDRKAASQRFDNGRRSTGDGGAAWERVGILEAQS